MLNTDQVGEIWPELDDLGFIKLPLVDEGADLLGKLSMARTGSCTATWRATVVKRSSSRVKCDWIRYRSCSAVAMVRFNASLNHRFWKVPLVTHSVPFLCSMPSQHRSTERKTPISVAPNQ